MTSLDRSAGAKNRGDSDPERRWSRMLRPADPPDVNPELGGCIIHLGADNGNGYVQFRYDGKNGYAHRYAWERVNGPIPSGLTIDHLCEVRRCVNVDHMVLAGRVENYLRTALAKTHCPNGHEYTPENTTYKNGRRNCRICRKRTGERGWARRARIANGLPNRRIRYDQAKVREVIANIRTGALTIAQGAREIGCHPNYLGRRTWEETKRDVFERDGGRCQMCGGQANDAHHRKARGSGGSANSLKSFGMANIISLCRPHHEWVETHRAVALDLGFLVSQHADPELIPVRTWRGKAWLTNDGLLALVGES